MASIANPTDPPDAQEGRLMDIVLLVTGAAAFYAATMILMKYWGVMPPILMAALIAGAFIIGAWCEIEALKTERLSAIYIAILGIEAVLISIVSFGMLGEQVTLREMLGGVLILAGVTLAAV